MLADHPIFVVFLVAVATPLLAQTRLGSRLPVVVFEVVLGIVIGPQVLGLSSSLARARPCLFHHCTVSSNQEIQ